MQVHACTITAVPRILHDPLIKASRFVNPVICYREVAELPWNSELATETSDTGPIEAIFCYPSVNLEAARETFEPLLQGK